MSQNMKLATLVFLIFQISSFASLKINLKATPAYVDNCNAFDQNGRCNQCLQGYVFTPLGEDGRFHCTKQIPACIKYSSSGACLACQEGRSLKHNVDLTLICGCAPGYQTFYNGFGCLLPSKSVPGCRELSTPNSCKTCLDGYYRDVIGGGRSGISFICKPCQELFGGQCSKCHREGKLIHCDAA